jgi:hypothetical protein
VVHEPAEFAKLIRIAEKVLSGEAANPAGGANTFVTGRQAPSRTRVAQMREQIAHSGSITSRMAERSGVLIQRVERGSAQGRSRGDGRFRVGALGR